MPAEKNEGFATSDYHHLRVAKFLGGAIGKMNAKSLERPLPKHLKHILLAHPTFPYKAD